MPSAVFAYSVQPVGDVGRALSGEAQQDLAPEQPVALTGAIAGGGVVVPEANANLLTHDAEETPAGGSALFTPDKVAVVDVVQPQLCAPGIDADLERAPSNVEEVVGVVSSDSALVRASPVGRGSGSGFSAEQSLHGGRGGASGGGRARRRRTGGASRMGKQAKANRAKKRKPLREAYATRMAAEAENASEAQMPAIAGEPTDAVESDVAAT